MEIHAPKAGVIEQLLVEEGASVTANLPIIKLKVVAGGAQPAAAASTPAPAPPKPASQPAPAPPSPPQSEQQTKSILSNPPPLPKQPASSTPISQIPITPFVPTSSQPVDINKIGGSRVETRVKMSKMRQTVATRLKQSQNTCAMLTTFNEINMA
jgi:2-oxoglutarate dehydrogenase E2 component (dihydrolipoamide succinyltransferase)